jgi:sortase A
VSGRRLLRHAATALAVLLAVAGLWQIAAAGTILAKAWLAQVLLAQAWAATLGGASAVRPWPWADTYPVARLQAPSQGIDQVVLAGASVLSGHRDTHFRFLRDLRAGSRLRLQRPDGAWQGYRVVETRVIDARRARLHPGDGRPALTLVTCYPFDAALPGGPLRYLVFAEGEPLSAPLRLASESDGAPTGVGP